MYEGKDGLPDDEKELLENTLGQGFPKNWILFTPTELLKQYVRNALDNQGLGELNRQMSTWEDRYLSSFFSRNFPKKSLSIIQLPGRRPGP